MGRGKVELKKIEDKANRQVTFSKRRPGLMKKAKELSVLCDVDVAVHIFSNRGKMFQFHSGERYTHNTTLLFITCFSELDRLADELVIFMYVCV